MDVNSQAAVKASGSMMRATAKAPLTGITRLGRSTVEGAPVMQSNREKLFVVVRSRADKIFLGEAAIVEALTGVVRLAIVGALTAGDAEDKQPLPSGEAVAGNRASPSEVVAIALLVEVIVAVKRGNRAAGVVQAVGAVAPEAVAGLVAVAAGLVVAVAVEADDKNWLKIFDIINCKFDGGKSNAYSYIESKKVLGLLFRNCNHRGCYDGCWILSNRCCSGC